MNRVPRDSGGMDSDARRPRPSPPDAPHLRVFGRDDGPAPGTAGAARPIVVEVDPHPGPVEVRVWLATPEQWAEIPERDRPADARMFTPTGHYTWVTIRAMRG